MSWKYLILRLAKRFFRFNKKLQCRKNQVIRECNKKIIGFRLGKKEWGEQS